jgi:hypothetical protein
MAGVALSAQRENAWTVGEMFVSSGV